MSGLTAQETRLADDLVSLIDIAGRVLYATPGSHYQLDKAGALAAAVERLHARLSKGEAVRSGPVEAAVVKAARAYPLGRAMFEQTRRPLPDTPFTTIGPDRTVNPSVLVPGCVIRRYTEPAAGGRVLVAMPCDDDQRVLGDPEAPEFTAICRRCGIGYTITLIDEADGGFAAQCAVIGPVALSRAGRRATLDGA